MSVSSRPSMILSSPTSIARRQPFVITAANTFRATQPLPKRATLIAEKVDRTGRHVRQIELCPLHCQVVIERERSRALDISDRRK